MFPIYVTVGCESKYHSLGRFYGDHQIWALRKHGSLRHQVPQAPRLELPRRYIPFFSIINGYINLFISRS